MMNRHALAAAVVAGTTVLVGLVSGPAAPVAAQAAQAAQAAGPVGAAYDCSFGTSGVVGLLSTPITLRVPVSVSVTPSAPLVAGSAVPAGAVQVSVDLDLDVLTDVGGLEVSTALSTAISLEGQLGGRIVLDSSDPLMLGSVPVTTAVASSPLSLADLLSDSVLSGTGSLDAFTPRGSGLEPLTMPASFQLQLGDPLGELVSTGLGSVTCTSATGAPAVVSRVEVLGDGASAGTAARALTVSGPHRGRLGRPLVFRVTLPGVSGRVVASVAHKVVARSVLRQGFARVRIKGLRRGPHRIVFSAGPYRAAVRVVIR